jgi:hypothetical protein
MTKRDLLAALVVSVTSEKITSLNIESTGLAQTKREFQQDRLAVLKEIRSSGNLENIIAAEKFLVQFDIREYANSKNMTSSLSTAQEELETIETNIGLVSDPKRYKVVDTSIAQRKLRDTHDLPLDGARIAFRSHNARLVNYDKARSDDHEKAIIQARRQNIKIAENLYIERQEKALGREPREPAKPQAQTMTQEQFGKKLAEFIADAQKQGASPEMLAAFEDIMKKSLDKQA